MSKAQFGRAVKYKTKCVEMAQTATQEESAAGPQEGVV